MRGGPRVGEDALESYVRGLAQPPSQPPAVRRREAGRGDDDAREWAYVETSKQREIARPLEESQWTASDNKKIGPDQVACVLLPAHSRA